MESSLNNDAVAAETPDKAPSSVRGKPLWLGIVESLVAVFIIIFLAQTFFFATTIDGEAMSPTLRADQLVLISRAPYVLNAPQRGDMVAVRSRINPSRLLLFRVVGLPGDQLNVKGAQVSVNNRPLREPYLPESIERVSVSATAVGQYLVGKGEYFLMNDNRANTDDSRTSGMFAREDLVGRAWLIAWPLESIKPIAHTPATTGE